MKIEINNAEFYLLILALAQLQEKVQNRTMKAQISNLGDKIINANLQQGQDN